jgi:hypothetical protein
VNSCCLTGQTIINRYQPQTPLYNPIRQFEAFRKVYLIFGQKFNDRLRLTFTGTEEQNFSRTTMPFIVSASYEIQRAWVVSKVEMHVKRVLNICPFVLLQGEKTGK